jgi:fructuronate reductase
LGNFFRAHTCWYTEHSVGDVWGIAAFSGRTATHVDDLEEQGDVYTLVVQGVQTSSEIISTLSAVHRADELAAWRGYFASPQVSIVTSTITEGGYLRDASGNLDLTLESVQADISSLVANHLGGIVTTAPGKFVAGLLVRRHYNSGPVTFVPCDNVVDNGSMIRRVVTQMAEAVDPTLAKWMTSNVTFVSTMVDRITPGLSEEGRHQIEADLGYEDKALVITEPFTQWVLSGDFAGERPAWESAGATFVGDIVPFEHCKLWLLNGAHSLMAYAAPLRGHTTVQDAIVDPVVRGWVEQWWDEAGPRLPLPSEEVQAYRTALLTRFTNPTMRDVLSRIAADGSQKLPIRFVPVVKADLAEGIVPIAGLRAVAAWVLHIREDSTVVNDVRRDEVLALGEGLLAEAVIKVLAFLGLPEDLRDTVWELVNEF